MFSGNIKRFALKATALAMLPIALSVPTQAQASTTDKGATPSAQAPRIVRIQLPVGPNAFLDAHETGVNGLDFSVVTRGHQSNNTQRWLVSDAGGGAVTLQQVSSLRYLDAHETGVNGLDFRVVTRPAQSNDTQRWKIINWGGGFFSLQQVSSGRFMEAKTFVNSQVVTRPETGNDMQVWRMGS